MTHRIGICPLFQLSIVAALLLLGQASRAQLIVRVVDVGAGLCCVVKTSDGHYMIVDAKNYQDHGKTAMLAIEEMIPYGSVIDLLVLSHCDADHIAAVPFICENYTVREVWRDGFNSGRATWRRADEAVVRESEEEDCIDANLQQVSVQPGDALQVGNATVTFLCGFADVPSDWGLPSGSGENKNARSIVVRVDYGESSILFGGDTVGRHIGDPWWSCIAAEKALVDNSDDVSIDIDVVVAPHHGADNGSSYPFIQAMSPEYVIFSAGSKYHHPRWWAVNRYLTAGVPMDNIFRTDFGDHEGDPEWGRGTGDADPIGDDDVVVRLFESGSIDIKYMQPADRPLLPSLAHADAPRLSPQISKWVENDAL